jgi:hypothetical protein
MNEQEALHRLIAHALIVAMPAWGLEETVSSLRDISVYHRDFDPLKALPSAGNRLSVGIITRKENRPGLSFVE